VIEGIELELDEVVVVVIRLSSPDVLLQLPASVFKLHVLSPVHYVFIPAIHWSFEDEIHEKSPAVIIPPIDTIIRDRGNSTDCDFVNVPFGCRNRSSDCASKINSDAVSVRGGSIFPKVEGAVFYVKVERREEEFA